MKSAVMAKYETGFFGKQTKENIINYCTINEKAILYCINGNTDSRSREDNVFFSVLCGLAY